MVHAGNVRAARIDDSADRVLFDVHTPATRKATAAAQEAGLAPAESSDPASAGAATGEVPWSAPALELFVAVPLLQVHLLHSVPSAALLSPQQLFQHGPRSSWLL